MTNHDKNLELAMKLVAADNDHANPCLSFNGYCFDLNAAEDMELLRMLALHEPIRDQLEEFSRSLADCLNPEKCNYGSIALGGVSIYLIQAIAQARSTKALNELTVFSQRKAIRRKRLIRLKNTR